MITNTCICFPLHLPVSLTPTVFFFHLSQSLIRSLSLSLSPLWCGLALAATAFCCTVFESPENVSPLNMPGFLGEHWFAVTPQFQGLIGWLGVGRGGSGTVAVRLTDGRWGWVG